MKNKSPLEKMFEKEMGNLPDNKKTGDIRAIQDILKNLEKIRKSNKKLSRFLKVYDKED